MIATLIAIFISAYIYFFAGDRNLASLFMVSIAAAAILLSFGAAALLVSFLPIQKGEQNITPRLSELFRKDFRINGISAFLFSLPIIIFGVSYLPQPIIPMLILIGIGIDLLYLLIRRIMDYLNPFQVVNFLKDEAFSAVAQGSDERVCNGIEACAEVAVKSIQRHNSALANHSIDTLGLIGENFLVSSKSLSHPIQDQALKEKGVPDSLSFVLVFLCQHLESIYMEAFDKKLELVAGFVITTLTKISVYAAKTDVSLLSLPLFYINKIAQHAMENGFQDVGIKTTIGLTNVAESIAKAKDIQYQDLKAPFVSIISTMDMIAKETFRLDKSTKIAILVEPFKKLQQMVQRDPIKQHQDQSVIEDQLKLVLNDFSTLETVLATMPAIPSFVNEEEK